MACAESSGESGVGERDWTSCQPPLRWAAHRRNLLPRRLKDAVRTI